MKFDQGLQVLKHSSNEFLKNNLLTKEEVFIDKYDKHRIPIGRTGDGQILFMSFSDPISVCILGKRGSGKTFVLRGIMDRLFKAGYDLGVLTDVKNEFYVSSLRCVQKKFQHLLLPGEKPSTTPTVVIRPYFYKTLRGEDGLRSHNFWGSCDIRDVSKADFFEFVGYDKLTVVQQIEIEKLYDDIEGMGVINSIDEIEQMVMDKSDEDMETNVKRSILRRLYRVRKSEFFNPKYSKGSNPVVLMQDGFIPCINLEGYEHFGSVVKDNSTGNYPRAIVGMWLNILRTARRKKLIRPLWVVIDEASRFCNSRAFSNVRAHFEECVDVDRKYGISLIGAWQEYKDVPSKILSQSKYLLLPNNIALETLRLALRDAGVIRVNSQQKATCKRIKDSMRRVSSHSWLLVDCDSSSYIVFEPLCPLSAHAEASL